MTDISEWIRFRHDLHTHPELSGKEYQTAIKITEALDKLGNLQVHPIGGTGVLATLKMKEVGPVILLRADTDALPILEAEGADPRSENDGVAHLCGHDGHSSTLLATAEKLLKNPPSRGTIHLLFQPSEENGKGAAAVLADKMKIDPAPDYVFAWHNLPGYPLGQVVSKEGSFTAAANSIRVYFKGKTSHAAEPEHGINPADAMAELIRCYAGLVKPDMSDPHFRLMTPVYATMGEKSYGVSAGYGELHYTLRTWNNQEMDILMKESVECAEEVGKKFGVEISHDFTERFYANQNHSDCVDFINKAAKALGIDQVKRPMPFKWGEDFGLFTEKFTGAMFGIGSGEDSPALHNPDFQFPDELIATGSDMLFRICQEVMDA